MLKAQVYSRIRDVPIEHWEGLISRGSCTYSREFWEIVERAGLNDFRYRYAVFSDRRGNPVGLASFYSVTTDIAIFAPAALRALLAVIRRAFPDFLKLRILECGTPITLNSPPFAVRDLSAIREVIDSLDGILLSTAQAEGHSFIVIRDFEPNAEFLRTDLSGRGYHWVDSLPNTYLDIRWSSVQEYIASMRSYYRSKLLRHLRRNEKLHVRHALVDDFHELAETLCAQWNVVHEHADEFQREVLTPVFYREFSLRMGGRSKALLFYREDELVGHALLLMDGDLLRWLYVGRKKSVNDSLYIYIAHCVVETAILLGAKRLELGLTTYSIKQDLGAQVTPIKLALRSASRLLNPFVAVVYPLVNKPPRVRNKVVFKLEPRPDRA